MNTDINFPNLHIRFSNVGKSVDVFGFSIAYYGITIGIGMLLAVWLITNRAKKANINEDATLDICIWTILLGVVCARIYYVIFAWDIYRHNLLSVFYLREGGLAIYGGIIGGMITCFLLCKKKKIPFLKFADIVVPGILVGQAVGRWGNFFNREVFGQYTDGLFAMELPVNAVRSMEDITQEMISHGRMVGDVLYVQVHPTFLYESMWNLLLLIFLLWYTNRKSFNGELFCFYIFFYGAGRFWIEALRTDQLKLWNTDIPVSQALAAVSMFGAAALYIVLRKGKKKTGCH